MGKEPTSYETISCKRCGKPITRVEKISDYGDICGDCITEDERQEILSPAYQKDMQKRIAKYN